MKGQKFNYQDYHKIVDGVLYKRCAHHKILFGEETWLPSTDEYYYPNDKNKTTGLNPECKTCTKVKSIKWRKENPENYRMSMQKTDSKEHRVIHHQANSKRQRDNGQVAEWQNNNKDKISSYTSSRYKNKTHTFTEMQWIACKQYFNNECAYCGLHISEHFKKYAGVLKQQDLHKDHVDDEGSNGIENCVPSCHTCNSSKNARDFNEWYSPYGFRRGSKVYLESRYNRIVQWLSGDYKTI